MTNPMTCRRFDMTQGTLPDGVFWWLHATGQVLVPYWPDGCHGCRRRRHHHYENTTHNKLLASAYRTDISRLKQKISIRCMEG
jgi:hypothetical protein